MVGTPFNKEDVPGLLDEYVHFASPRFWNDPPCVNGQVKYVDGGKGVVYLQPYGVSYLVRVDTNCYELAEKIEEHEQHSSH